MLKLHESQAPSFKIGVIVPERPGAASYAAIVVYESLPGNHMICLIQHGLRPGEQSFDLWKPTTVAFGRYLLEGGEIPDLATAHLAMKLARAEQETVHRLKMVDDPRGRPLTANICKLFAKYMRQLTNQ